MRKARIRRRPPSPNPLPGSPLPADDNPHVPDVWRGYFASSTDRRSLKIAGFSALLLHFALFFVVLPAGQVAALHPEERATATVLQHWEPPAPRSRPAPSRARPKRIVPVPRPVADAPLLVVDEVTTFESTAPSADFAVTSPATAPTLGNARSEAVRIGATGLSAPRLLEKIVPEYTASATRAGVRGRVYIEAVITEDGRVVDPVLQRGVADDELNRRALEAVQRWTFEAGRRDGKAVKVIAVFTIDFNIH